MSPSIETLVAVLALAAVMVAWGGTTASARRSPVAARLRSFYGVLIVLLALRLGAAGIGGRVFDIAQMVIAAWLPYAALRLVEEFRRRHASRRIKLLALGGGIGFSLLAIPAGLVSTEVATAVLAGFQTVMFGLILYLLAGSRRELSAAERKAADSFLLALLIAIPLAVTDFPAVLAHPPIRGGVFAILILVLATSRAASGAGSVVRLLADIALMTIGAGIALLAAQAAASLIPLAVMIEVAAVGAAFTALLLLIERAAAAWRRGSGLIAALAHAPNAAADLLGSHPLLASGRVVGAEALANYPAASMARLAGYRVISQDLDDPEARDIARDLLDAVGATHLLRLSLDPPGFLAVSAGDLAAAALDDELEIAARLLEGTS